MAFDQTSLRLFIKEHGKTMTLRRRTPGGYNATTGVTNYSTLDYSVYGYSMNASPYELTPESIVVSTRKIILSAKQTNGTDLPQPDINDQVIVDGLTFDVVRIFDSKSHDTMIFYTLVCRG